MEFYFEKKNEYLLIGTGAITLVSAIIPLAAYCILESNNLNFSLFDNSRVLDLSLFSALISNISSLSGNIVHQVIHENIPTLKMSDLSIWREKLNLDRYKFVVKNKISNNSDENYSFDFLKPCLIIGTILLTTSIILGLKNEFSRSELLLASSDFAFVISAGYLMFIYGKRLNPSRL